MAHLLGQDMGYEPMMFLPFRESFCLGGHMNTGFADFMLILNKAFLDLSMNAISEPEMLAINWKTSLCPPRFVPSVWTKTEILVLFKSFSK